MNLKFFREADRPCYMVIIFSIIIILYNCNNMDLFDNNYGVECVLFSLLKNKVYFLWNILKKNDVQEIQIHKGAWVVQSVSL